jgi:hypothetical protein
MASALAIACEERPGVRHARLLLVPQRSSAAGARHERRNVRMQGNSMAQVALLLSFRRGKRVAFLGLVKVRLGRISATP